jgi:CTP:molybdopterin cytidylyltransferase MocA
MHILPAAGNAVRFGGIPKYLLPSNREGKSLLRSHIDTAMSIELGKIIVMSHPSMHDFLTDYLSDYPSRVIVDKIESRTMTETIVGGVDRHGSPREIISITLPDTATTGIKNKDFSTLIERSREKGNCLMLYPHLEDHRGKFGQVLVSQKKGEVADIVDKSLDCNYPLIWGGISIVYETVIGFDTTEPTIGNCIKRSIEQGTTFQSYISDDRYYDCGSMKDYLAYLESLQLIF